MANGFRFGNAVLPGDPITLRDLYTWFPIAPAVNIADFSGQFIQNSLNTILGAVFDRNVFMQRGGWYLGLRLIVARAAPTTPSHLSVQKPATMLLSCTSMTIFILLTIS